MISKDDVIHLAALARIELTPAELERYTKEMNSILEYVGKVQELAGTGELEPQYGDRYNIFRQDKVTNEADSYTKEILAEMPETTGRYMVVKKILQTD